MIKFFRKIRQKNLTENKFGKYLTYVIGEIILVVIGILIALQINNSNERKKEEQILNGIYSIIVEDLKNDIDELNDMLKTKKHFEPYFKKVMNDEMTLEDYKKCPECVHMALSYRTLTIEKRGYNLLENFGNSSSLKNDSLSLKIIYFYSNQTTRLHTSDYVTENLVNSTLELWQKYDWFSGFASGNNLDGFIDYALNNQEYKNSASLYYLMHYTGTIKRLNSFIENASSMINLIDKRLAII
jgi:hypothetical protein